ncbi:MAG TPA: Lrp/AsnC family transcriptional regulator [Candidatus Nanoarchaeia archaeon]|nr:Lrp/AsnC family transcriptional regulator [Candidatus Nanoarchaeia archaeon]
MSVAKNNNELILKHLRRDARKSFSSISRETGIPVTTVFDNYQKLEKSGIIKKHASLLDFRKLGYYYRSFVFVRANEIDKLLSFLNDSSNVNSIFRTGDNDYLVDVVFPSIKEFYYFIDSIREFNLEKLEAHDVIEHLKKEEFFC